MLLNPCFKLIRISLLRNYICHGSCRLSRNLSHESKSDENLQFSKSKIGSFFQKPPQLENQYEMDVTLVRYLHRVMPKEILAEIEPDLKRFGKRVTEDIYQYGLECEENPPKLIQYDPWGKRIDKIMTTNGWKKMKDISAEEGIVAIAYDRKKYSEWSRLYHIAKLYLYSVSSSLYGCPIAMTDGAAKSIESLDKEKFQKAYNRLTSRDPNLFWTSGQWMTERQGGSDVANGTETVALPQEDGTYRLHGYKWFSSATDSDMALTLARIPSSNGEIIKGTKGLTMFYLETRTENGELNNIEIVKLKNKLGTRQLPTAELLLTGTKALKMSDDGRGVAAISNMLTITRIHNAVNSAAVMRRIISMARDYSQVRVAFGQIIGKYPLHTKTLAEMDIEARGCTLLILELGRLLGLDECSKATDKEKLLLRLLTPIAKLYTAKRAMSVVSEGLEAFGGQGYIEDTGLPRLLRDAQVTPIWEGTTNILSLDVLRAIAKTRGEVLLAYKDDVNHRLASSKSISQLESARERVKTATENIEKFLLQHQNEMEAAARDFAFSLAQTFIGALLIEHASWMKATKEDIVVADRWNRRNLTPILQETNPYSSKAIEEERRLLMEGYTRA